MVLTGFLLFALPATAQQTMVQAATSSSMPPSPAILHDDQDIYNLGPNAYITADPNGRVSYNDLITGHLSNHRGVTTEYSILPMGTTPIPHWIIMAVKNESQNREWVLSLGTHATGRYGSYSRLFIYNHLAGNYLLYAMPDKNGVMPKPEALPLNGSGVAFDLAPGKQALLVAYIVPEGGAPVTFVPQIMTEHAYWNAQNSPFAGTTLLRMILLGTMGYFFGLLILRQSLIAISFIAYLLAQSALFEIQNVMPYSDFLFAGEVTPLLLSLCVLCGLVLTKLFLNIHGSRSKESLVIYGIMLAITLFSGMALSLPDTSGLRPIVLLGIPMLGMLFMALLSVAQAMIGKPAAGLMAVGWFVLLGGRLISDLSALGTLTPSLMMVNAYLIALVLQCAIFIGASFARVWAIDQDKEDAEETAEEDADAISRIRQAKDGSENARLLKVIEHERSILQELRDRELQQNEEMRRAKDGADMANRAKSAFLAVISHEIRTPMSGIMGMVRLLLDTTLSKDQRDYARTIQDSGDAMLALLNDILDFEKIESGKMELEIVDFDLLRLVNDIMTLMSGHASQKKIVLKADIDPNVPRFVRGDPVRLRQVLLNLTGNAIKFTSEGSVILSVKIPADSGAGREGWNKIYFGIRDSGIGISKEAQKNLFNPFSQADNSISRKYGGTGLGLAICQRLIEAMGDKIAIDSIEGQGSTFYFTVLTETGHAERVEDVASSMSARHNQKPEKVLNVLCVDDNDINLKLLKEFVSRLGHHPTLAGSGEQAINLMKVERFDMILMDIALPGISGMGATRAIRALPDRLKAAVPIIALTGNVRDEDIRQCYAANMNGHLAKPIEPDKLKAQIDKVIQGKLDNPVTLEKTDIQSMTVQEVKISDEKQSESPSLSFEDETLEANGAAMPSIRAYALRSENPASLTSQFTDIELDEDSFAEALILTEERQKVPLVSNDVFDHALLDGLKSSMKPADLKDMVESLTHKNDEILLALQTAIGKNDLTVIGARAHEMKGMSGNFGLKELATLAGQIEKAVRENAPDDLSTIIAALPEAANRSKAALDEWMSG